MIIYLAVLLCLETKSQVVSKEEFESYNVRKAFIVLQTKMCAILKKANFGDIRRACISQMHTPDGVEFSEEFVYHIIKTTNTDDLFDQLVCSPYWSWIDLRIMEAMVAASGSPLAYQLLENYKDAVFSKRLIDVLPDVPNKEVKVAYYKKIAAKLMKEPSEMTVADLLKFQSQLEGVIMDIKRGTCTLERLDRGCVEAHWYIPISLVDVAYQNTRTRQYQFHDLCLQYLKIGHYPEIYDPLYQTDIVSTPVASVDIGK